MEGRAIFEAWAPPNGKWTPWAKPILFAHLDAVSAAFVLNEPPWLLRELFWPIEEAATYRANPKNHATAVVVDLPGVEGVELGLALAEFGCRPVPLYNALPSANAIVPMYDVIRALVAGATRLAQCVLHPQAPPAFLLDARRGATDDHPRPGQFDNRSFAFEKDFPPAAMLREAGILDVVLVHSGRERPRWDLHVTLARWKRAGISIRVLRADRPSVAASIDVQPVGLLSRFDQWLRRAALLGDRRGGFGSVVRRSTRY